ncbi:PREDICTED: uncharacterized protein LOC106750183 isoform X2 [Dinoponera quadriceps]|uniref:Uncharacterized protein LOC106750183 isoform X2 n=1 Tax=Dinoponera quadriceps TaxID=609295 RepID=A0A6P3Y6W7_DINQU|nr:PREDICTED: uncharacterized protein LOC106750183 isoform X2 [Dinoponera quadriceps]
MSLLSSSIGGGGGVRFQADEDADHNMLQDLQLAAELGKTLLERNKELENIIKLHQSTVEEQAQEIEYMKKQTAALREVNNSRLKIYEQLEVSVQDLERANHRLVIENTSDKKLIKSQCMTIESLEVKCEELQKKIDELTQQREALLRQQQQAASPSRNNAQQQDSGWKASVTQGGSVQQRAAPGSPKSFQETTTDTSVRQATTMSSVASDEEMNELLRQLQDARSQRVREQMKVSELSQQLTSLLQENSALEEQLTVWRNKAQDVKNLQDEISTLEEVRRGQLCGRCLRGMDTRTHDELSIMLDQEEYDDISMAESLIGENNQRDSEPIIAQQQETAGGKSEGTNDELNSANPYRVLVEKYQALLEVQRHCQPRRRDAAAPCMSLQEELEMSGEFNNFCPVAASGGTEATAEVAEESAGKSAGRAAKAEVAVVPPGKKSFSATPTADFSEAETSSSGFSDETSNKATQTDGRPGSFLCSIADGEDCKFSIYDDNSPFESRFRKTPEYRQLFSEIFSVLKRAAEAKDEGEKLPLLDESTTTSDGPAIQEDPHSETATDDNQSVMSSVVSSVVSEPVFRVQPASPANNKHENKPKTANPSSQTAAHHGLDYLSINVHVRKKPSVRKNAAKKAAHCNDRPTTPDVVPTTNPKFVPPRANGRRRYKPFNAAAVADQDAAGGMWNGQHHVYSRFRDRRQQHGYGRGANEQQQQQRNNYSEYGGEYKPSTASEEVARLKRLEMSYAEVLRTPNKPKANNHHHHRRS